MKIFRNLLSLTIAASILFFASCSTLIPEQTSINEGFLIIQVDTVSSVSPDYRPRLNLEFVDHETGQRVLEITSTATDGLRSFPMPSGMYQLEITPSVNTRNGGRVSGETSETVSFSIPRGTVLILDRKLEFMMSGAKASCRWENLNADEVSDIKSKVLAQKNQLDWNLAIWDSDLSEPVTFC